ncbi:MAG: TetR/AcrR family transcriptional regulator [Bacteroidales bacterium]|jgi:AcrR family transcriptional regulator|nr:TetR/AcrR family transcriptional regulator [Bacteroidales bacterium]MCI1733117.1 TetR/AcrR family transcriptional regulator [Bacteroidales bacterium]
MIRKEQIMETAFDVFAERGIKGVSMDEIVKTLKISKKTLYDYFSNKEDLVLQSCQFKLNGLKKRLDYISTSLDNSLEVIVFGALEGFKFFHVSGENFKRDAYGDPELQKLFSSTKEELDKRGMRIIKRGVEEGMIEKEQNFDVLVSLFRQQLLDAKADHKMPGTPEKICFDFITTVLRGICTDKGKKVIDELRAKYN